MTTVLIACAVALAATALLAVVLLHVRRNDERPAARGARRALRRADGGDGGGGLARARSRPGGDPPDAGLQRPLELDRPRRRPDAHARDRRLVPGRRRGARGDRGRVRRRRSRPRSAWRSTSRRGLPSRRRRTAVGRARSRSGTSTTPRSSPTDAIRAGIAVPLLSDGDVIGYLAVYTRGAVSLFGEAQARTLEELALRAGPAIQNARRFREARQLADLDALTGLHNRRYFHETLGREVARAQRYGRSLGLVIIDLDDFKAVNDRIGHLAGDGVLAEAAERVRDVVRSADVACRVGGDEFAVILPGVRRPGRRAALPAPADTPSRAARSGRPGGCSSRPAAPSCGTTTTPSPSSSAPTRRSIARSGPARASSTATASDDGPRGPAADPGPRPIRPVPNEPRSASETAGSS